MRNKNAFMCTRTAHAELSRSFQIYIGSLRSHSNSQMIPIFCPAASCCYLLVVGSPQSRAKNLHGDTLRSPTRLCWQLLRVRHDVFAALGRLRCDVPAAIAAHARCRTKKELLLLGTRPRTPLIIPSYDPHTITVLIGCTFNNGSWATSLDFVEELELSHLGTSLYLPM